jgi:hypothetical protein
MRKKMSDKQFRFAKMTILLFQWLVNHGYKFTFGAAHRKGDRLLHGKKLAIDINLWIPMERYIYGKHQIIEYEYTHKTEDHRPAGEFWESIGGSWGGRFKKKDGNHYSLAHNKMK